MTVGAARGVYWFLPASAVRSCCDSLFPELAKDIGADSASGYMHRFKAGHDLLTDVVFSEQDFSSKLHRAGHILLTDFPTKAGIPIPGFSENGLGHYLVEMGIPKGWMCLNICDFGIGIYALPEGSEDLVSALAGDLPFNFFDTMGEGAFQLSGAIVTENPLLLLSGIENVAAGVISLGREINPYFQLESFLGSTFAGFAIGCAVSLLTCRGKSPRAFAELFYYRSARAISLGALASVSPFVAIGASAGCLAYYFGKALARRSQSGCYNPEGAAFLLQRCMQESEGFKKLQQELETLSTFNVGSKDLLAGTNAPFADVSINSSLGDFLQDLEKSYSFSLEIEGLNVQMPELLSGQEKLV